MLRLHMHVLSKGMSISIDLVSPSVVTKQGALYTWSVGRRFVESKLTWNRQTGYVGEIVWYSWDVSSNWRSGWRLEELTPKNEPAQVCDSNGVGPYNLAASVNALLYQYLYLKFQQSIQCNLRYRQHILHSCMLPTALSVARWLCPDAGFSTLSTAW